MIDGLFKKYIDPAWEGLAKPIAAMGISANQVTIAGLVLITVNAAVFTWHHNTALFGFLTALAFAADSLDGAVARLHNRPTRFGGYLDAMIDRYQELVVLLAIAYVHDLWPAAMLALAGSFLTSYAKARVAIETPVNNDDWPDLFERLERVIYLCALLILQGWLQDLFNPGFNILAAGLWLFAALTHFTALQRLFRARYILDRIDRGETRDGE